MPPSTAAGPSGTVDHTALRVNQAFIVGLLTIGFLLDAVWLVAVVAAVMAAGTVSPALALFQRVYRDLLRPAGLLRPDVHAESAAPHRFAQGMGASVLGIALVALLAGASWLGWALVLIVVALAAVNLIFGFCTGCFIFFQLERLRERPSRA
jgi:hypothetical protein